MEYDSLTPYVVTDEKALKENVLAALNDQNMDWIEKNREYHLASGDGCATQRILDYIGI